VHKISETVTENEACNFVYPDMGMQFRKSVSVRPVSICMSDQLVRLGMSLPSTSMLALPISLQFELQDI